MMGAAKFAKLKYQTTVVTISSTQTKTVMMAIDKMEMVVLLFVK